MKKTFLLTMTLFFLVWAFSSLHKEKQPDLDLEKEGEIDPFTEYVLWCEGDAPLSLPEIDRQIKELEQMKRGYEARALRHDDQAQRLQFEDRALLETRRHNELAEENRAKAQKVQDEIDRLQGERSKLIQSS